MHQAVILMRPFACALCALCLLFLFLGGALWGFEQIALNPAVYDRIQQRLDIYEYAGLEPAAQSRVNQVLAGYLRGELDSIDTQEEVFGVYQEVFNEDEKAHMIDVLQLFRLEQSLKTAFLLSGMTLMLALPFLARRNTLRIVLTGAGVLVGILALTAGFCVVLWTTNGFDALFITFHHIFFSNDLWLMDPRTDAMIRMLPSDFFMQIAAEAGLNALTRAVAITAGACLIMCLISSLIRRIGRKQTT